MTITSTQLARDLQESMQVLQRARIETAGASLVVWRVLNNASLHLDRQMAALLGREA